MRIGYFPSTNTPDGYDGYTFGGKVMAEGTRPLNGNDEDSDDSETTKLPPGISTPTAASRPRSPNDITTPKARPSADARRSTATDSSRTERKTWRRPAPRRSAPGSSPSCDPRPP